MKSRTIAIPAAGLVLALALLFFLYRPGGPDGRANGVFTHDCCGTLVLRDGAMVLNDTRTVPYTVGQDARGPYILPDAYVGGFDERGFEVDGTRRTTKLRLDRLPQPTRILLYYGNRQYLFERKKQWRLPPR